MPVSKTSVALLAALSIGLTAVGLLAVSSVSAQEKFETWPLLKGEFPSTGGGGIVIKGYNPVIAGGKCSTPFSAHDPNGAVYNNIVEFDAVPAQGGILCTNGKWRAVDGSATGTTPFRVFFKDGVVRGSP